MSSIIPNLCYPQIVPGTCYRQPGGEFTAQREGNASAKEKYVGLYADFVTGKVTRIVNSASSSAAVQRAYKYAHPDFPSLLLFTSKVTRGKGDLGTLDVDYRGLDPNLTQIPPPVYGLSRATSNEPLGTNPKWDTDIAGNADYPLNGAIFQSIGSSGAVSRCYGSLDPGGEPYQEDGYDEDTATFQGWLADSPFSMRDDYLAPGSVWRKSYTSFSPPSDISNVGKIVTPDGPVPTAPDNCGWFYVGEDSSDQAGIFRNEASWKLVPTDAATLIIYDTA